jgi:Kef-type K+ transport system membrane component KefB/nucleotide-binding universal stress UspA family protein
MLLLLCQIAVVLSVSRVLGALAVRLGQPQVVGEMVAGIALGPSLLGLLAPGAFEMIFPPGSVGSLNVLSQIGVVLFLFLIGLELDPKLIKGRGHAAVVISQASIFAPLLLGIGLAFYLFPKYHAPDAGFWPVALFMGAAMSVTAFPVLARILTERNLHRTPTGAIAITSAAVNDVSAWCLLAFVMAIATADGSYHAALKTLGLSAVYVAVMMLAVRPFLNRLQEVHDHQGRLSQGVIAIILLLVLTSAAVTDWIGIHALFGAFMIGAVMPKGTRFVRTLSEKLEDFTVVLLLPLFFAYTGLQTRLGLLNTPGLWIDALLIILVACLGKFGGSAVAGRVCGLSWRESSALGVLMNTRGLMELIILRIGLELGVVTQQTFAMMVMMAIATTCLTTPLLAWIFPRRMFSQVMHAGAGGPPVLPHDKAFDVLIPVASPRSGGPLLNLASLITGHRTTNGTGGGNIVALHLRRPVDREAYRVGLDESITPAQDESLEPLLDYARSHDVAVQPVTFTSVDIPGDIAQVAADRHTDLVLIGFHNPVFGKALLGGTVASVLRAAETDVAVFIDRGFETARTVVVPFLGTSHDRLALDLAARMGRSGQTKVTVLHVIAPRTEAAPTSPSDMTASHSGARHAVERIFADPTQANPVMIRTVESATPVSAVLEAAREFDLVVVGVAETWGLESQVFGLRPERIARDCPTSLLIVRKHTARN